MNKKYENFTVNNEKIIPNGTSSIVSKLSPGNYEFKYDQMSRIFWFQAIEFKHDQILDLPSPEYTQIVTEMNFFLKNETKEKFSKLNYLYKRSALLHGPPGTGKTIIVNRISRDVVKSNGICLWVKNLDLIDMAYEALNDIQPETLVCVILEEFDYIAQRYESKLLSLLDGQTQKQNVVYLATTNYIDKIPPRLYRPGRFSSVIEVKFPIREARSLYLTTKLGNDFAHLEEWLEKSETFSIDELKELIQSVYILECSLEKTVNRILDTKKLNNYDPVNHKEEDYNDEPDHSAKFLSPLLRY